MSIILDILNELNNTMINYKGVSVNLFGIPKLSQHKYNSLKSGINQLKKKEFIAKDNSGWFLTPSGKKYIEKKYDSLIQFESQFSKNDSKNLLVMFDIPETKKAEREWLRWHLKKFHYQMIQRSVWRGPSPLPKEFIDYLKKIKIYNNLKMLKISNVIK
ncbi:CRISPR-associated endonuclease Cas2 [Candidatus Nomurabacteria bacterium CG_4_10_14_0_2_um_filter_30_12]|uniref:CRISPR-associated endonuclease Cas2 n=2 Tax=Candidatus Nomuraibacteriota TaxID=1752729 RepID=A0A2J0MN98_9BACT|nr:MAG: CRISPR-associated endonuclease Cas2 [Candidatus Nomurabacteria bacterium CG_4_10_14_0_2_um_filter_30_12]